MIMTNGNQNWQQPGTPGGQHYQPLPGNQQYQPVPQYSAQTPGSDQGAYYSPYGHQPYPMPPRKSKAPLFIGLGIVILALIAGLAFWLTSDGGGDGKPSRADVRAGIEEVVIGQMESQGQSPEMFEAQGISLDGFYDCVVDDVYDEVSDETLRLIAAGDPDAEIGSADASILGQASNTCMAQLMFE